MATAAIASAAIMSLALGDVAGQLPAETADGVRATVAEQVGRARTIGFAFAGVSVVIGFVVGGLVTRSVVRPISRITKTMDTLAAGDTDVNVPYADRADEIGRMARAIEAFRTNAEEIERLQRERRREQRRAEERRDAQRRALADDLKQRLDGVVGRVENDIANMRGEADDMIAAHEEAESKLNEVAHASDEAYQLTEAFAQSATELTDAINDIENRINQVTQQSERVDSDAQQGDKTIQQLVQAADAITEITDMIRDIAKRTNLLALNATVEAKRAGEAGKSFAVVASEVQKLSQQTNEATDRVEAHVRDIKKHTDATAESVRGIISGVSGITESASEISGVMERQTQAAQQITQDVDRTRTQIQTVKDGFDIVRTASGKAAEASQQVRTSTKTVADGMNSVRGEVSAFLQETTDTKEAR